MATNLRSVKAAALTSIINSVASAGVKITGLTYIGSATAANPAGSETVTVAGSGFNVGATVYVDTTSCATTYVSATSLTFTSPAKSVGSYHLFVYNTDGSSGILPAGFISSNIPVWVTASGALSGGAINSAYSQSVSATGDSIVYSVTSGSLPTGLSLNSSTGAITGTAPGTTGTSNFTITATDAQNQGVARSFSIQINAAPSTVDYLVVAGGGGGGSYGGGGGGGGYLSATSVSINAGVTYTIAVGAGGIGGSGGAFAGIQGANSSIIGSGFTTVTSVGGGGGGTNGLSTAGKAPTNGGSGGGGGAMTEVGLRGVGVYPGSTYINAPRQGYDGGTGGGGGNYHGAGGGGAGGVGANGGDGEAGAPGNGGLGLQSSITGTSLFYAGGGGGSGFSGTQGTGGSGVGGSATSGAVGNPGTTNRGGGGAGGAYGAGELAGGNGGSGVVIIRYSDSFPPATSTTGSPTVTNPTGYKVYTFTSSGSITF
jgi:hypothetical protein